MEYNQYLQTTHWKSKRQEKLNACPFCQICKSSSNLQIHHKHYKNKQRTESILYQENLTDLVTLCASCHRFLHIYFGINIEKLNKKICRIRRMIELGAIKKYAFYASSQNEIFVTFRNELIK